MELSKFMRQNDAADTIVAQGGCLSRAMLSAQKGLWLHLLNSFEASSIQLSIDFHTSPNQLHNNFFVRAAKCGSHCGFSSDKMRMALLKWVLVLWHDARLSLQKNVVYNAHGIAKLSRLYMERKEVLR